MLSTLTGALLVAGVWGHGRLTKPMTRIGSETAYENDPIGFGGRPGSQFICRHDSPNPSVTPTQVTAGEKMDVSYRLTAAHVGDCAYYMSYDVDKSLEDMRWFKIGNQKDCKSKTGQVHKIDLPDWLPAGPAVFRWEWYALHVYPTIEFYAQCADIVVNPTANALTTANIPTFKVYENGLKNTLPENGNEGVGFRNAFGNGPQDMTGPECALNSQLNNCAATAVGTPKHVDVKAVVPNPVPVPTPAPTSLPAPTSPPVSSPPVQSPTSPPVSSPPVQSPTNPPVQDPVYPPVASPTSPPVDAPTAPQGGCDSGSLYAEYTQCDGEGFTQSTGDCPACPAGFQCYRKSKWYSNCNHSCPSGLGWDCENTVAPPSAAPSPIAAPAPTAPPATAPTASGDCPNQEFSTCGGFGTNVPSCCPSGMTCTYYSVWHSQCMKN